MKKLVFLLLIVLTFSSCTPMIRQYWKWKAVSEEGRRTTFEETKSYNEGKEQELLNLYSEYKRTKDADSKSALAFTIRHKFADYDENKLSPELRNFLKEIKY